MLDENSIKGTICTLEYGVTSTTVLRMSFFTSLLRWLSFLDYGAQDGWCTFDSSALMAGVPLAKVSRMKLV